MDRVTFKDIRSALALGLFVVAVVACRGAPESPLETEAAPSASPTLTAVSAPPATPTQTPEEEVQAAYLRFWDAYSKAVLNLEPELVKGVAMKDELAGIQEEIELFRKQGVAARIRVEHNIAILEVREQSAVLLDTMRNNSFYVDPITKQPPEASGSGEILRDTYYLEKVDSQWVVVRSTRKR